MRYFGISISFRYFPNTDIALWQPLFLRRYRILYLLYTCKSDKNSIADDRAIYYLTPLMVATLVYLLVEARIKNRGR